MKDMLDDIFFEVLDCVLSQIDGEKSNFSFCYDNHGYVIAVSYTHLTLPTIA